MKQRDKHSLSYAHLTGRKQVPLLVFLYFMRRNKVSFVARRLNAITWLITTHEEDAKNFLFNLLIWWLPIALCICILYILYIIKLWYRVLWSLYKSVSLVAFELCRKDQISFIVVAIRCRQNMAHFKYSIIFVKLIHVKKKWSGFEGDEIYLQHSSFQEAPSLQW